MAKTKSKNHEFYRNKSNRKVYKMLSPFVTDATNDRQARVVVLYKDVDGIKYVRDKEEFYEKFEELTGRTKF